MDKNNQRLSLIIGIFFFWGFVAASNSLLIPVFKQAFNLQQWQSQLVDFAFYLAYFIGSLIYFIYGLKKGDLLAKWGYEGGLIRGLLVSALGAFGFIPAALWQSFPLMLLGLFVVGLGFCLQQIAANPYVMILGPSETGAHRISLAGGLNSLGTSLGPLILAYVLFDKNQSTNINPQQLASLAWPYFVLGLSFLLAAFLLKLRSLRQSVKDLYVNEIIIQETKGSISFLLKKSQIWAGMLAIFCYVGLEVSVVSNLPELMQQPNYLGLAPEASVHFIALYWGSLMVGRWLAAAKVLVGGAWAQTWASFGLAYGAFGILLIINYLNGSPMADFWPYLPVVLAFPLLPNLGGGGPRAMLFNFSLAGMLLVVASLSAEGGGPIYALVALGLCCSVMWPCIFALSLAGLGAAERNQASSLLIMMILGGALIPPLQGYLADVWGIAWSYVLPLLCLIYLCVYAFFMPDADKELS